MQIKHKSAFSFVRPLANVTPLAFAAARRPCSSRSMSPGFRALSSKPAAVTYGRRDGHINREMDRQTDARQFHRPRSAIMRVVSKTKCLQCFDAVGWPAGRASGL